MSAFCSKQTLLTITTLKSLLQTKFIAPLLLLLTACGGGGGSEKSNVVLTPDNVRPTIEITAPSNNANFEENDSISFAATANDQEDGSISGDIQWSSNQDGNLGTGSAINATLSVGTHQITASVSDSSGSSATASVTLTVSEEQAANTAPSLSITSPANNSELTGPTSVTFSGSASDSEDGNLSANINWTSSLSGELGTGASVTAQLEVGTHTITANVADSGNLTDSDSITVVITEAPAENTAPSVAINSPTNGSSYESGATVSFSGSASDEEDGNLSANIQWSSNLDGSIGTGSSVSSTLSAGSHTITALVTDSGNLANSTSISITVNAAAENNAPEISITSPGSNSVVNEGESFTFTASATDEEDGDISANVIWSSDRDGNLGTGSSITDALSVGSHLVTASITDSENATTTQSINVTVNALPTATAENDKSVDESQSVSMTVTASDSDGTISSYQWEQTSGESVALTNASSETANFTSPALNDGENSRVLEFEVTVTDNQGATATDTLTVTVLAPVNTDDCTLTISPGDSFDTAFGQMSAGDVLCLNDGVYSQMMDIPSNMHVRAVHDGMAEIDGGSTLGIDWRGGLVNMHGENSSVRGLRVHHASQYADACNIQGSNNTMKAMSCSHGGSYKHSIPLQLGGTGHLVEDSWFFGEGRYVVMCFEGDNMTLRRNVMRWDSTAPNEPTEPNAAISNYSCRDMIWENNISLDYGQPETRMVYCGDFCMSSNENSPNERVKYLGNMVINHHPDTDNNRAFRADQKGTAPSNNIEIRDFYMRSVARGMVFNSLYEDVTVANCTSIDVEHDGQLDGQNIVCSDDADISVRYIDGVKTNQPLFPFEFEDLIKRDMCASGERQSDWCSSGKSLEDYILNQ